MEFSNPVVNVALVAEQANFDPAQRVKLLQKAMSVLMDEAPVAWLFQYQGLQGSVTSSTSRRSRRGRYG